MELKKHENGFWTREACFEVAKQCTCVKEMYLLNGSAYNAARAEGWIKDYTWFQTPTLGSLDSDSKCYTIYVYEDPINKVCYVGLSKNWKKRHASHKRMIKGKSDTVKQYFDRMRKELPLPKILESIQSDMFKTAKEFLDRHIFKATNMDEMKELYKWVKAKNKEQGGNAAE